MARTRKPNLGNQLRAGFKVAVFGSLQIILASSVLLMMGLTFVDVLGRYLFTAPISGAFEMTQFLLAITVFAALPLVTWREGHIVVSLFEVKKQGLLRTAQRVTIMIVSGVSLGLVALFLWREAVTLDQSGQVTGFLQWPFAPLVFAMCGFTVVAVGLQIVKAFMAAFRLADRPAGDLTLSGE